MQNTVQSHKLVGKNHLNSLIILTILFFMWGLLTSLNDVLIPHLKSIYTLTYVQAMLVQFCFFGAYFVVSVPAGALIKKLVIKMVWWWVCWLLLLAVHFFIRRR